MVTRTRSAAERVFFFLASLSESVRFDVPLASVSRTPTRRRADLPLSQLPRSRRLVSRVIPRESPRAADSRQRWGGCWIGYELNFIADAASTSRNDWQRGTSRIRDARDNTRSFISRRSTRARDTRSLSRGDAGKMCSPGGTLFLYNYARAGVRIFRVALFGYPCTRMLKLQVRAFAPFSWSEAAVKNRSCYVSLRSFARKFRPANRSLITAR